jgi:enterochelin esterase-like enzyme
MRRPLLLLLPLPILACSSTSSPSDLASSDLPPGDAGAADHLRPPELRREARPPLDQRLEPDQPFPTGPITLHLKKPGDWNDAHAHYWKTWPDDQSTTWPGVKLTPGSNGWYSITLAGQQSAGIVFNDGGSKQTVDLWRERTGWFVPQKPVRDRLVGRWYDRDPDSYPRVSASPPGGSLFGEEVVTVEAEGQGIKAARYTLDGSDPKTAGTSYSSGEKIVVGAGLAPGQTLTLRLWADGAAGDDQQTYLYQRLAAPVVEAWDGKTAPKSVAKSGRFVTLASFPSPQGLLPRDVLVHLPADYDSSPNERWPVIYAHDGNNLFHDVPGSGGSSSRWNLDDRYEELIGEGLIRPAIVVGPFNTADRSQEYAGCVNPGKRDKYVDWILHTLKPYVDAHYRTRPQAEHTTTLGSSYGGLISHVIAWSSPSVFGNAMTVSTQFANCTGPALLSQLQTYSGGKKPIRYWIDSGTAEGADSGGGRRDYVVHNRAFAESLAKNGWSEGEDLTLLEVPGAEHHESYWTKRVKKVLYFLLRKAPPRLARTEVRSFLPGIPVGASTYASTDLFFENDYQQTKIFADTTPPFTFVSTSPAVATLDPATGQVQAKAVGATQLKATYQSFSFELPFAVK